MTADQARRAALAAQGFVDRPRSGPVTRRHLSRVVDRVGAVQIDSINVLARSHEIVFFSRLGPYSRPRLQEHIERHRQMFEYWGHMASFLPIDLYPLLRWRMELQRRARSGAPAGATGGSPSTSRPCTNRSRRRVRSRRASSRTAARRAGPGGVGVTARLAVEYLFAAGRVTASGRRGTFERLYDLPERVIPADVLAEPSPDEQEAQRQLLLRGARAMGVATDRDISDYYRGVGYGLGLETTRPRLAELVEAGELVPVEVDGWPPSERAYMHPEARIPRRVDAAALLSPFDSLVWERARTERIFGMRYRIEVYTPAPKRVYGYYVLPFLLGDTLVARVDLKADRRASTLLVPGAYAEPPHDAAAIAPSLAEQLRRMADWLELESVTIGDRGDLAAELRAAEICVRAGALSRLGATYQGPTFSPRWRGRCRGRRTGRRVVSTAMVTSSAILTRLRGSKRATMAALSPWPSSSTSDSAASAGLGGPHRGGVDQGVDHQIRPQGFDQLHGGRQPAVLGDLGIEGRVFHGFGSDPDRHLACRRSPGAGGGRTGPRRARSGFGCRSRPTGPRWPSPRCPRSGSSTATR